MSVSVTLQAILTVAETLSRNIDSAPGATRLVTHSAFNQSATLTESTTPAVNDVAAFVATLSGGSLTLDLAALTNLATNGYTLNATGKRVKQMLIVNPNANPVTITKGGSNGYQSGTVPFTDDGLTIVEKTGTLPGFALLNFGDKAPTISGSVKTLLLTGTGTDAFYLELVFGPPPA